MKTRKILIVDDDSDLLIVYKSILQSENHTIVTANSSADAVNFFNANEFDIVILDLIMEEFDSGLKLCSKFREKNKDLKIYLLSAVGEHLAADIDIRTLGFNGVIDKPVKPDELLYIAGKGNI